MAIYYAQELIDRVSEQTKGLRNETANFLMACGGGTMTRLGGEDWEAPMALELGSGMRLGEPAGWHDYLGIYKLESREVNGKPCWRHAERSDLWLAFDGVGWAAQPEDRLGDRFGWLQLRDPGAPHLSKCMWQAAPDDASRWLTQPDLRARSVAVPDRFKRGRLSGAGSSDSRSHVDAPCESRKASEPPPLRLRDSVEGASGDVAPPSIKPPSREYVARAKGMATSAMD